MPVCSLSRPNLNTGVAIVLATLSFPAVNVASLWEMSIAKKKRGWGGVAVGGVPPIMVRNNCAVLWLTHNGKI